MFRAFIDCSKSFICELLFKKYYSRSGLLMTMFKVTFVITPKDRERGNIDGRVQKSNFQWADCTLAATFFPVRNAYSSI